VKRDCVSSSCRLAPEEELQLLESELVVTSEDCPAYRPELHDPYSVTLCFNRQQQLRAFARLKAAGDKQALTAGSGADTSTDTEALSGIEVEAVEVECRVPPRDPCTNWPYYMDNTVFGEDYAQMVDVNSAEEGDNSWKIKVDILI
jgi:hypothetical protein